MNETYLALDLGGTKLLVGEVDRSGTVLSSRAYPTGHISQRQATELIVASIDDFMRSEGIRNPAGISAIGIGLIGRIDADRGEWCQIDSLRSTPLPLARIVSERYGTPCRIDNDVKCATRAEQMFGAGRESRDFIYINIGTGIAAGIVSDGRLIRGSHHNAGEVGHTSSGIHLGLKCVCEREDCTELIAAGVGLDACARLLHDRYDTALQLPAEGRVDARRIVELAAAGDELCSLLVENASTAAADLIMNLVRVSDPDTVILGGGVASSPYVFDRITSKLGAHTMRFVTGGVRLSSLDPRLAGLIGAAAAAIANTKQ